MSAKHTPGPWACSRDVTETLTVVCTTPRGLNKAIARVGGYGGESRISNAHLMAAAPELLDALQAFVEMYVPRANSGDWGNWNPEEEEEVIAARAAIAKALGEAA